MNKAITDNVNFSPRSFIEGLQHWSDQDGTPGSTSYADAPNATLIASDANFGTCLELQKQQTVTKLRAFKKTRFLPGCYLKVTARVKLMGGQRPSVRIAGWPGTLGGVLVPVDTQFGPEISLGNPGQVVEISAIFGTGKRTGVDVFWPTDAKEIHFGLDLIGPNGAVIRIDDFIIEDATHVFHRKMMNYVDVIDYGAVNDGVTPCADAFDAADDAAKGRDITVPDGNYLIERNMNIANRVKFTGKLIMSDAHHLCLQKGFNFSTYKDAFENDERALKKALQALFNHSTHESLDLNGRTISLAGPIDVHAAVGNVSSYTKRRSIRNGAISASSNNRWNAVVKNATAAYSKSEPTTLSNVTNISQIPVGSLVTGSGVGREIYVVARSVPAQTLTLSNPLYGATASQSYKFTRFKFMLDFSGFQTIQKFNIEDIFFQCNGVASVIMLPQTGIAWHIENCFFMTPKDRAICSPFMSAPGIAVTSNEFVSNEYNVPSKDRTSIAITTKNNDTKIRNNRAVRFRHAMHLCGGGQIISSNHFWQGQSNGVADREPCIVIARDNTKTIIEGNYIDNSYIEICNEYNADAKSNTTKTPFSGLSITNNIFTLAGSVNWFSWIRIRPFGPGCSISDLSIIGNTFKAMGGNIAHVEKVETALGDIDHDRSKNINVHSNCFWGVNNHTACPALINHNQSSANSTWSINAQEQLPFKGYAQRIEAITPQGPLKSSSGAIKYLAPAIYPKTGSSKGKIELKWSTSVKGKVLATIRSDIDT